MSRQAEEKSDHVVGYSLHPGAVNTEITRYHEEGNDDEADDVTDIYSGLGHMFTTFVETLVGYFGRTPYQGAQTIFHCCLTDAALLQPGDDTHELIKKLMIDVSGGFYDDCVLKEDYRMKNWYSNMDHQVKQSSVA